MLAEPGAGALIVTGVDATPTAPTMDRWRESVASAAAAPPPAATTAEACAAAPADWPGARPGPPIGAAGGLGGGGTARDGISSCATVAAGTQSAKPCLQTRSVGFRWPSSAIFAISFAVSGPCWRPSRARYHSTGGSSVAGAPGRGASCSAVIVSWPASKRWYRPRRRATACRRSRVAAAVRPADGLAASG